MAALASSMPTFIRMHVLLENLVDTVPLHRGVLLRAELKLLERGVERDFRDPADRVRAASADSPGVGGARRAFMVVPGRRRVDADQICVQCEAAF